MHGRPLQEGKTTLMSIVVGFGFHESQFSFRLSMVTYQFRIETYKYLVAFGEFGVMLASNKWLP
jgi:hypothetical protein